MGGSSSTSAQVSPTVPITTNWRTLLDFSEAKSKYTQDKTVDSDCSEEELELRILLDDPLGLKCLLQYCETPPIDSTSVDIAKHKVLLLCWKESQNFPVSPGIMSSHRETSSRGRQGFLTELFTKFGEAIKHYDAEIWDNLWTKMEVASMTANDVLDTYRILRRFCVRTIYKVIFVPFKDTEAYVTMCDRITSFYNSVSADDFFFTRKIAEGGFGVIFQCTKRSTNVEYAMKVQPKAQLLRHFKKDHSKVLLEMQAYARCVHPYLSGLEYAFHTPSLAVLVMPLASCGDLRRSLSFCPGGAMSFERVQFYTAEITDALCYLHFNGILYRDLKPTNILLNRDGHIRLADFGSVADMGGKLRDEGRYGINAPSVNLDGKNGENSLSIHSKSHVFAKNKPLQAGRENSSTSSTSKKDAEDARTVRMRTRTGSLVGTLEYMAPEIIIMFGRQRLHKEGYTDAVDWWSLGITVYKLLVGVEPYRHMTYDKLIRTFPSLLQDAANYKDAFQSVFGTVNYELPSLNEDARTFIGGLLQFDASKRLGNMDGQESYVTPMSYGNTVLSKANSIREHPFFKGINWNLLENKQLPPPYLPERENVAISEEQLSLDHESFSPELSLNQCVEMANKGEWIASELQGKSAAFRSDDRYGGDVTKSRYFVSPDLNVYFNDWNHCSQHAIALEIAAQKEAQAAAGPANPPKGSEKCLPF